MDWNYKLFIVTLISIFELLDAQMISPCPRLFSYEPQKERDRWYGVVTLISESDLNGVWLRLIFDRPAIQLGNWFGEIKTTDNKEFLIKNRNHNLKANMPYSLRFYIKYDPNEAAPQLMAFRLNAKTICPEGETTTPLAFTGGSLLQTSGPDIPTPPPKVRPDRSTEASQVFARPGGGWQPPSSSDDDDVFQGDFQLINRPHLKPTLDVEAECGTVVSSENRRKRQATFYRGFNYPFHQHLHHYSQEPNFEVYQLHGPGQTPIRIHQHANWLQNIIQSIINNLNSKSTHKIHRGLNLNMPNNEGFDTIGDDSVAPIEAQPKPLITYGQKTMEGEYPWHAALYHEKGADLQYICGASLLSKYHVITVAHCVTRRRSQTTLNPDSLVVYLGKYYLKKWSNPGIMDSQVSMIFPHPEYNSQTYANDIALIKLVNPATLTDYVRPICLWSDDTDLNSVLEKPGTVVGWGFDHTGKVTEALTMAKMPVVSKETCIYSFPDFFSRFTTSKTYCAGFRNGTSVCNGDSGGGMVFPKSTSTPNRQVWQLRGLVSISVALQNQFRCDSSHYVVFTDVAKYLDWIKETMAKM